MKGGPALGARTHFAVPRGLGELQRLPAGVHIFKLAELATWTVHREYLTTVPELYTGTQEFTAGLISKGCELTMGRVIAPLLLPDDCCEVCAQQGLGYGLDTFLAPLSLNADCPDAVKLGLNSSTRDTCLCIPARRRST